MTQPCPSCDYDLRGAPTSICPECGFDMKEVVEMRKRFSITTRRWEKLFIAAVIFSSLVRIQHRNSIQSIDIVVIVSATIGFILFVSSMGLLMSLQKPKEARMTEFLLWFRCSFWIHLPWIIIAPIRHYWTNGRMDAELVITFPYILFPFLGVLIWMYRYNYLRRKAALPRQGKVAPTFFAICCIIIGWVAGAGDVFMLYFDR